MLHGASDAEKRWKHVCFFTRNPRGGKAKEIDPADVERFLELSRENHFGKLVAHAPYTMNACAAKEI